MHEINKKRISRKECKTCRFSMNNNENGYPCVKKCAFEDYCQNHDKWEPSIKRCVFCVNYPDDEDFHKRFREKELEHKRCKYWELENRKNGNIDWAQECNVFIWKYPELMEQKINKEIDIGDNEDFSNCYNCSNNVSNMKDYLVECGEHDGIECARKGTWRSFEPINKINKIINKNEKNKNEVKNMNEFEIFKKDIEKIKKERNKLIKKVKETYDLDRNLRDGLGNFSKEYIEYIFDQLCPALSKKSLRRKYKHPDFFVMSHIEPEQEKYYVPQYGLLKKRNPLSIYDKYLEDLDDDDWEYMKEILELLVVDAKPYLTKYYKKEIDRLTKKQPSNVCNQCGAKNPSEANYCNNCGYDIFCYSIYKI